LSDDTDLFVDQEWVQNRKILWRNGCNYCLAGKPLYDKEDSYVLKLFIEGEYFCLLSNLGFMRNGKPGYVSLCDSARMMQCPRCGTPLTAPLQKGDQIQQY